MENRIYWIDWLKVFTMLTIVYVHVAKNMLTLVILSFNIPLFFIISGYLYKTRNVKDEILVTAKSLILPYIILSVLFLVLHLDFNYKDYINVFIGLLEPVPLYIRPLWYVVSLAVIRIVMSFLVSIKNAIYLSIIFIISFRLLKFYDLIPADKDVMQVCTTMFAFPFFVIGKMLRSVDIIQRVQKVPLYICLFLVIPFAYLAIWNGHVSVFRCNFGHYLSLYYINAIVLSLITFITFAKLQFASKQNYLVDMTAKGMIVIIAYQMTAIKILEVIIHRTFWGECVITMVVMVVGVVLSTFAWKYLPFLFGKYNSKTLAS